jgi:CRISPR system Cascade subunit CasE
MFFSQATLRPGAARSAAYQRLTAQGHAAHRLVWSLFADDPDRDRDFVFRWDPDRREGPVLHVVSEREPDDREGLFRVQSKTYDPQLHEGQVLAFQLRANSVVKKRDENDRQRVHDVVMNAKHEMRQNGSWDDCDLTEAQLVQREGAKWLQRRTDHYGFAVDAEEVRAESHRKHSFQKPRNGRDVTFTTMDLAGRLRVVDPGAFRELTLFAGVGPSKAYGCGLLLVRPL